MVTRTQEEFDAMSAEERKQHFIDEESTVFANNGIVVRDRNGQPVEQGLGSPGHETQNHFNFIRKGEGEDAYWTAVADLWRRDANHAQKIALPKPRAKAA